MMDQGSYYYSAPLPEVTHFKIFEFDGEKETLVLSEGTQGNKYYNYVVQSFTSWGKSTVEKLEILCHTVHPPS